METTNQSLCGDDPRSILNDTDQVSKTLKKKVNAENSDGGTVAKARRKTMQGLN